MDLIAARIFFIYETMQQHDFFNFTSITSYRLLMCMNNSRLRFPTFLSQGIKRKKLIIWFKLNVYNFCALFEIACWIFPFKFPRVCVLFLCENTENENEKNYILGDRVKWNFTLRSISNEKKILA